MFYSLCCWVQSAHHEFVAVLACLVKTYLSHPKFTDMYQLLNDDPEQDFFENVKHIQVKKFGNNSNCVGVF